jgi:hypothetical protein
LTYHTINYHQNALYINTLCSDNLPTVKLAAWPLEATLFDPEVIAGPVPTLFGTDEYAALEGIRADPLKNHWDLSRIAKNFFMAENIDLEAAVLVCKKPR